MKEKFEAQQQATREAQDQLDISNQIYLKCTRIGLSILQKFRN